MAVFMTQWSYTTEAWQAMVKNPQDRTGILREMIEKLGGRLLCIYNCYGEYDGLAIAEYPDNITSVACVLTAVSAGHLKSVKTTVLMPTGDTVEAMKKAAALTYKGPGD